MCVRRQPSDFAPPLAQNLSPIAGLKHPYYPALDGLRTIAVGIGEPGSLTEKGLRDAAAAVVRAAGKRATIATNLADLEGVDAAKAAQAVVEGALLGALLERDEIRHLAVISDGAPQFSVLQHGLCWVHAERQVHNLNPVGEQQRKAVERVRKRIWILYRALKAYQRTPTAKRAKQLSSLFDRIFRQKTVYVLLNRLLKRLREHKDELLLVLKRPEVPLQSGTTR